MSICIETWGDFALFSRPEFSTERVSYDIITPSAARGLIESIFYHPGLRWVIDRIHVCAPIRYISVRRNEVSAVIPADAVRSVMKKGGGVLGLDVRECRQQRASLLLRDVRYVISAHFEMVPKKAGSGDNPGKFQDIITRRLAKGQCFFQPYYGFKELPAHFAPCTHIPPCPEELKGEIDLGWMLYNMDWETYDNVGNLGPDRSPQPRFFRAVLHDGVLNVPDSQSEEVKG